MPTVQEVEEKIEQFQSLRGLPHQKKSFWAVASQFRANSLGDVLHTLIERTNLTVRNIMTYRYLGLLKKAGAEIVRTAAGEALVSAFPEEQQRLLDMQIAKIWLKNSTNPRMNIDVYPFEILVNILLAEHRITWDEYLAIVIWIQDDLEVPEALSLLIAFRSLNATERMQIVQNTETRSGSKDLGNQARRLHRAIAAHSLLTRGLDNDLSLTVAKDKAAEYLINFQSARDAGKAKYEVFLESVSDFAPGEEFLEPLSEVLEYREVLLEVPTGIPAARPVVRAPRKVDYVALAKNQALAGLKAEVYVLESEKSILVNAGRQDLADQVTQISLVDDGAGFDIMSFGEDGTEKHIEVKSVANPQGTSTVFISKNEIAKALSDPLWELVLVLGNGTTKPFLWRAESLRAAIIDANFDYAYKNDDLVISATQYQVTFRVALSSSAD